MQCIDLAPLLIVFGLQRSTACDVGSPPKLLPWRILHPVDPKERHSLYIVIDVAARIPSFSPCSIQRSILAPDQNRPSRRGPSFREGSMVNTCRAGLG